MHMSGEARVLLWLGSDRRLKLHCIRFRCPQSAVSCSQDVDQCTTPDILALTHCDWSSAKDGDGPLRLPPAQRKTEDGGGALTTSVLAPFTLQKQKAQPPSSAYLFLSSLPSFPYSVLYASHALPLLCQQRSCSL